MKEDFDEIEKQLWEQLGKAKNPEPSPEIKTRFYEMLDTFKEESKQKKASSWSMALEKIKGLFNQKPAFNWAYAMILVILSGGIGYFIGKPNKEVVASQEEVKRLSTEMQDMKQIMMLSMLENPAATERMKAVGYTQDLKTVDDQVIDALLTTLNNDENENVRIITVEALVELAHYPKVREGLVQSLVKQKSPLVQVALADAMVKLQEKRSVNQMKKLLQDQTLNKAVKTKLEKSIKAII
jgi:hypothetical protein